MMQGFMGEMREKATVVHLCQLFGISRTGWYAARAREGRKSCIEPEAGAAGVRSSAPGLGHASTQAGFDRAQRPRASVRQSRNRALVHAGGYLEGMSGKGNCRDNVVVERFFLSMETNLDLGGAVDAGHLMFSAKQ